MGNWGEGKLDEREALTALWFEGRMFREGEPGVGGGGICCEDALRDEVARKRGDGGTELRSGMVEVVVVGRWLWQVPAARCSSECGVASCSEYSVPERKQMHESTRTVLCVDTQEKRVFHMFASKTNPCSEWHDNMAVYAALSVSSASVGVRRRRRKRKPR